MLMLMLLSRWSMVQLLIMPIDVRHVVLLIYTYSSITNQVLCVESDGIPVLEDCQRKYIYLTTDKENIYTGT